MQAVAAEGCNLDLAAEGCNLNPAAEGCILEQAVAAEGCILNQASLPWGRQEAFRPYHPWGRQEAFHPYPVQEVGPWLRSQGLEAEGRK
jgi:hypothetical protein